MPGLSRRVRGRIGSAHGREHDGPLIATLRTLAPLPRRLAPVVVFDAPLALLLLGEPDVEVEVEIAAERGPQGNAPPIRRLYASSFASGARATAASVTSPRSRRVKPAAA